jgi:exopolysaccharide biosynthesis polyprenyl glycosylphosphotransferase
MLAEQSDLLHVAMPAPTRAVTELGWFDGAEAFHRAAPRATVVMADVVVVVVAVAAAGGSRVGALAAVAAFLVAAGCIRLYARRSVLQAQGLAWYLRLLPLPLLAMAVALAATGHGSAHRLVAPVAGAAGLLVLIRGLAWLLVASGRRRHLGLQSVLLVGPPARTTQVARRIEAYPEAGLQVAATYAPANTNGERSRARALLQAGAVGQVLVTAEAHDDALLGECSRWSKGSTVEFGIVLPVGTATPGVARIGDLSVVVLGNTSPARQPFWAKRALDIALCGLLLLLLVPVFVIVSVAIYLYDRGPVIYRQRRVGLNNREFTIWKFRSMVPGADKLNDQYADANVANGLLFKLPDDPRVTPVGNLIRRLSIDELPQLVNVLLGNMSLVGPRPLPVSPDEFDAVAAKRHLVRPGITGPWQVAGGHVVGYDDMIKLDLAYVESWSLRRDLWMLLMTIPTILIRRSAY